MKTKPLILQLDSAGNPTKWIDYEKAAYYYTKDLISWEAGSNEITLNGGVSRITGNRSRLAINSIVAVAGKVKSNHRAPSLDNRVLFRRDLGICTYCGRSFSASALTRDHIIPKVKGGKNTWRNCITSCKPCNNYKGEHLIESIGLKLLYVPYTPSRAEYLIHTNNNITDDQLEFLKAMCSNESRITQYLETAKGSK